MATDAFRCDVFSADQLARLAAAPLPLGIPASPAVRSLHRDLHLDTADGTLARRGVACRLRVSADDRHLLTVRMDGVGGAGGAADGVARVDARVRAADPAAALQEDTAAGRRLRAIVDPALLEVRVALEVERLARLAHHDWLRRPRVVLHYDRVTVRRGGTSRDFHQLCAHRVRGRDDAVARLAAAFQQDHGLRLLAADRRARAELLLKWMQAEEPAPAGVGSDAWPARGDPACDPATPDGVPAAAGLNAEVSLLAFQERVLALAEDAATPLAERLRFLEIVGANVDEFFAVRVAGLKMAAQESAEERGEHGLTAAAQLALIAPRVAALAVRQERCAADCVRALAERGVRLRAWSALGDAERRTLRARFRDEILPALTPMAMTLSPGHPFPRLPHLSLSIAAVVLDRGGGAPHFVEVELPPTLPRLLHLPGGAGAVPLEEVVRANLDALEPHRRVDQAYLFRVTRGGDLHVDESLADDLLEAVDAATRRRPHNAVARVEVERGMPPVLRDLVLDELRREPGGDGLPLGADDVYEIAGPYDPRCLSALELPPDPALSYPPFTPRRPVVADGSLLDAIEAGDLLAHHPFDSFADTVVRFLREAATDPEVVAIKATLYRVGDHSPVIDALRRAAKRGKQVVAFVELRARFDEERNVGWVRALADAGVHVAYGLVGVKTHAKVALVVRRDGGRLRRLAHVGTGNYNARTGLHYTDLSLFTADPAVTGDVGDLLNALTGSSAPPPTLSRGALVAPGQLLDALLDLIEREAAHARAGRPARIALKVNGLSDPAVVRALERASQDGATVDLLVRGVCTLRPGVPGRTERVRVVAVAGRLLEHSRIYHFANAGDDAWLLGSADLRPRNLRRRVELLVPVRDARARAELARLLDLYLADPTAWELTAAGEYVRRDRRGPGAQEVLLAELAAPD